MSKAVLMSMNPRQCELVASGEATSVVRKIKPKFETPFKVYIYCTKGKFYPHEHLRNNFQYDDSTITVCEGQGKVIGEFVCDKIDGFNYGVHEPYGATSWQDCYKGYPEELYDMNSTCLSVKEINDYGNGRFLYTWHISNLVIYDKPKALSEFIIPSKSGCCNDGKCRGCRWFDRGNGFNVEDDCNAPFCTDDYRPLRTPPKSYCYVEELN